MTQDDSKDKAIPQKAAQVFFEQGPSEGRRLVASDQDILRAMLGKPFQVVAEAGTLRRKAG